MFFWITVGVLVAIALVALEMSIFIVAEKSTAIIERFGKYHRLAGPGIHMKIPIFDWIVSRSDLRQQQLVVEVETKTKDNVFVTIEMAVQFRVKPDKVYEAHYSLESPYEQIKAYVYDVVRAEVPKLELDDVFTKKDDIATGLKEALDKKMEEFGYDIVNALVVDIDPAEAVKNAMNKIQEQTRLRTAAEQQGEAQKTLVVKAAEAEAESKKLQGQGIADQRTAIIEGLKKSVKDMAAATGVDAKEVLTTVLMTQHFDTMREIGENNAKVIFVNPSPSGLSEIRQQMMEAIEAK